MLCHARALQNRRSCVVPSRVVVWLAVCMRDGATEQHKPSPTTPPPKSPSPILPGSDIGGDQDLDQDKNSGPRHDYFPSTFHSIPFQSATNSASQSVNSETDVLQSRYFFLFFIYLHSNFYYYYYYPRRRKFYTNVVVVCGCL